MEKIEYMVWCQKHGKVGVLTEACVAYDVTVAHRLRAAEECGEISIKPVVSEETDDSQKQERQWEKLPNVPDGC